VSRSGKIAGGARAKPAKSEGRMKIRSITALPVNIPFRAPYRFSYGSIASLTKTVVQLTTEDGVVGLGECADGDRAAEVVAAGEKLIGLDVRDLAIAESRVVPAMRYTPWGNVTAARRVFGGIEMAMWDARGKTESVPLHLLLGCGAKRNPIDRVLQLPFPGARSR
jgi:glucarate dehydratase